MFRDSVTIKTQGRGTHDVTDAVADVVARSKTASGLCHMFLRHTSASLIVCENADPGVRKDLERFMARLVVDGDRLFEHDAEGPDDMPAHIRAILTQVSLQVPVERGRLMLGTWQGIYLWEHRLAPHTRELLVTVIGAGAAGE